MICQAHYYLCVVLQEEPKQLGTHIKSLESIVSVVVFIPCGGRYVPLTLLPEQILVSAKSVQRDVKKCTRIRVTICIIYPYMC